MTKGNHRHDLALAGLVHDLSNVFETISEASELVVADPQWTPVAEAIQRSVESGRRILGCYAGINRYGVRPRPCSTVNSPVLAAVVLVTVKPLKFSAFT